jgi:hypothetical protein
MKWNYENKNENLIYHFTRSETGIFNIIPCGQLRLNSFERTNDPREYKSFGFGAINAHFDHANYIDQVHAEQDKISRQIKKDCKVLCFCEDYFTEGEWWDGFNLPRMWAQYGENHKGICLEIDKTEFIEENKDILGSDLTFFESIHYTNKDEYPFVEFDQYNERGDDYLKDFIRSYYKYLFFQKNKDWETEHELRLIHFDNAVDKYCSIKKSLKKIIVGIDFDVDRLRILTKISNGVKLYKADYDNGVIKIFDYREEYLEKLRDGN